MNYASGCGTEVEHMPHNHGSRVQILPGVGLFSPLSSLKNTVMKTFLINLLRYVYNYVKTIHLVGQD